MDDDQCIDGILMDHLELAWGIIANVDRGDWFRQADEWREAAIQWRGQYHVLLNEYTKTVEARRV